MIHILAVALHVLAIGIVKILAIVLAEYKTRIIFWGIGAVFSVLITPLGLGLIVAGVRLVPITESNIFPGILISVGADYLFAGMLAGGFCFFSLIHWITSNLT